jgi:hypothetical protein
VGTTPGWTVIVGGDAGTELFDRNDPSRILVNFFATTVVRYRVGGTVENVATAKTFGDTDIDTRASFIPPMAQSADGTVFYATWRMFASKDFGTTWNATSGTTDLTTGPHEDDGGTPDTVTTIGTAPSDAGVVYSGSAQGRVMVSHDAGATWTDATPPSLRYVSAIAVDPSSAGTAYVGLSGYLTSHVYRTSNFGSTWTAASNGLPDAPVNAIYIDRKNASTIYAGTDVGVFRSDNGGIDWYAFQNGMPAVIVSSFTMTADGRLIAGTYGRGVYELLAHAPDPRRRTVSH